LLKKNPKYSKRINYDALKDLFVDNDALPNMIAVGDEGKDDEDLFAILQNDKGDEEAGELVIEEEGGGVGMIRPATPSLPEVPAIGEEEGDEDADGEDESDKGDDIGWEEAYEQEV
jgi:transcription factor IIIB subunit 2